MSPLADDERGWLGLIFEGPGAAIMSLASLHKGLFEYAGAETGVKLLVVRPDGQPIRLVNAVELADLRTIAQRGGVRLIGVPRQTRVSIRPDNEKPATMAVTWTGLPKWLRELRALIDAAAADIEARGKVERAVCRLDGAPLAVVDGDLYGADLLALNALIYERAQVEEENRRLRQATGTLCAFMKAEGSAEDAREALRAIKDLNPGAAPATTQAAIGRGPAHEPQETSAPPDRAGRRGTSCSQKPKRKDGKMNEHRRKTTGQPH